MSVDIEKLYQNIKEWVLTQEYTSIGRIQIRWSIGFICVKNILIKLQNEGLVSVSSSKLGYRVIK